MSLDSSFIFENPAAFRQAVLEAPIPYVDKPEYRGAHFYVHLTGICDVACEHCMYSSDQSKRHSAGMRLDDNDIELVLQYISDSAPVKVTISGGGEPFLEMRNLLRLVEAAQCQYIELITAANWARHPETAGSILRRLGQVAHSNACSPRVLIRASIDQFHINAPNPVPLAAYVNFVNAWRESADALQIGFRGLLLRGDSSINRLADALGGTLQALDSWNYLIRLPDGVALPVTLNVLRFSGKGERYESSLAPDTVPLQQYFAAFEESPNRLLLGRAINDAIKGSYYPVDGLSITLDYNGALYIFTATAPDHRCNIRTHTFRDSVDWFYRDPITRILMTEGPYWLCDVMRDADYEIVARAIRANDVCSMVDTLLSGAVARGFVTAAALKALLSRGAISAAHEVPVLRLIEQLSSSELLRLAQSAFSRKQ
jgi:hypothetical protein